MRPMIGSANARKEFYMDFYSPNLPKSHFIALLPAKESPLAIDESTYEVYCALDARKSVKEVAVKLGLKVYEMRQRLMVLWDQGLLVPVDVLDGKYVEMLKMNFSRMIGEDASRTVGDCAAKLGLSVSAIPVSRLEGLLEELAGKIADEETREKFKSYMLDVAPGFKEFKKQSREVARKQSDMPSAESASAEGGKPGRSGGDGISRGKAKKLLDMIVVRRSKRNPQAAEAIKVKLALKGMNPDDFTENTPDNPALLKKIEFMARQYGIDPNLKRPVSRGQVRMILDCIITQRSGGDPSVAHALRTKLVLKGIDPDRYSYDAPDDPQILERVKDLAHAYGVAIGPPGKASKGKTKLLLDAIITGRSKGNPARAKALTDKFADKGLDPASFSYDTPDNPAILKKLEKLAEHWQIRW